ncbi:hypothetical protein GC197_02810 [bacterium]|nr:hypothetical protein [bacterium]
MKKLLFVFAMLSLTVHAGCAMCCHPFDYNYAAFDEAQLSGSRAGSAWAPYSTQSVITEEAPSEEILEEPSEEEVLYYDESAQ